MMIQCPVCAGTVSTDAAHCPHCGHPPHRSCTDCSRRITPASSICPHCGSPQPRTDHDRKMLDKPTSGGLIQHPEAPKLLRVRSKVMRRMRSMGRGVWRSPRGIPLIVAAPTRDATAHRNPSSAPIVIAILVASLLLLGGWIGYQEYQKAQAIAEIDRVLGILEATIERIHRPKKAERWEDIRREIIALFDQLDGREQREFLLTFRTSAESSARQSAGSTEALQVCLDQIATLDGDLRRRVKGN